MSRSHKHTPITGHTLAESEKEDKKIWHGNLRTAERELLSKIDINTSDDDNLVEPHIKEVSEIWDGAKDGKQYLKLDNPENIKLMRK
jgi:hypothetical protein